MATLTSLCESVSFPGGSVVKNPPASTGDMGSIPGLERSSGEGNDHPTLCVSRAHYRDEFFTTLSVFLNGDKNVY